MNRFTRKSPELRKLGDASFSRAEKVSSELFTLTYGAIVVQLFKDCDGDAGAVNEELRRMGYRIGVRLVDEFLVESNLTTCQNFRETGQVIAKVAFKMFLGLTAEVIDDEQEGDLQSFLLRIDTIGNPFIEYVEIPERYSDLVYGNMLCGVLEGALEMVQLSTRCVVVGDVLKGDQNFDIRIELLEILQENVDFDF